MSRTEPARSWWQDEPARLAAEQAAMEAAAPGLAWLADEPSGGWEGDVPLWPFTRTQPPGLPELLGGRPLEVRITCGHAFPMVEPSVLPLSVDIPFQALGWTTWHMAPDRTLCLMQESAQWDPGGTAADLIPKISGWNIEFWLMSNGLIDAMTARGIAEDSSYDSLLAELGRQQ
jgi:hypothetical protein